MCPIASSPCSAERLRSSNTCGDEAEVAQRGQPAVLADRDAGRLLAAVLQRVEPEVGEARDVAGRRANAEDAAHQTVPSSTTSSQSRPLGRGDDHAAAAST